MRTTITVAAAIVLIISAVDSLSGHAESSLPASYNPFAMSELDKRLERSRQAYREVLERIAARQQAEEEEKQVRGRVVSAPIAAPVASQADAARQRRLRDCLDDHSVDFCLSGK